MQSIISKQGIFAALVVVVVAGNFLATVDLGMAQSPSGSKTIFRDADRVLEGEPLAREKVESFFGALTRGKVRDAYEELHQGTSVGEDPELLDYFIDQTNGAFALRGDPVGHELIEIERRGSRLLKMTYLTYHGKTVFHWKFYCYRSPSGWQIMEVAFNTNWRQVFGDEPSASKGA